MQTVEAPVAVAAPVRSGNGANGAGGPSRAVPVSVAVQPAPTMTDLLAVAGEAARADLVRVAPVVVGLVPVAVGLALWSGALPHVDLRAMNDLGVVSVLPWQAYAAIVSLTLGFCLALRRRRLPTLVIAAHLVALAVVLYGLVTPIEEVPRLSVSWRHAGIADHLAGTGEVDPTIDAYFNWPGFFALLALVSDLTGLAPIRLATPASVVSNLLYVLPVLAIARALTTDQRVPWLAAWVFLLANWVGQDYLSPQGLAFFLHLVVMALLLTWFRTPASIARGEGVPRPRPEGAAARVALLAVVLVLLAAVVPSHQLTPFASLAAIAALVVARRCTARGLPFALGAMIAGWISFMTVAYLKSHMGQLVGGVGDLSAHAGANVGARLAGSPEHLVVVRVRLLLTGALWGLAVLGAVARWRRGHRDVAWMAAGAAFFPLVALQSYGGEMLLRVYLFALPFVALFVALLIFPTAATRSSRLRSVGVGVLSLGLAGAFLVSRYGNERENQFSAAERAAADRMYDLAPPGSLVMAAVDNLPWRSQHYADHDHETLVRLEEHLGHTEPHARDVLAAFGEQPPGCAYLIVTRSQDAKIALEGIWAPTALGEVVDQLRRAPSVETAYANRDAVVLRRAGDLPATCPAGRR